MSSIDPEADHLGEAPLPHHPLFKAKFIEGPYKYNELIPVAGIQQPGMVRIIRPCGHAIRVDNHTEMQVTKELLCMTDYFKELQEYLKKYPGRKSELEESAKREDVDFNAWLRGDIL